jgi:O-glycosyl hydrolase
MNTLLFHAFEIGLSVISSVRLMWSMPARVTLSVGLMVQLLLLGQPGWADTAPVTIDGAQTYQVIDGFGVNANHRSWNNNELQPVLDALIDQAGMTLFRVIFDKADWEATNDNSDPNLMDWGYYSSTNVYNSQDFQKMWDMSAYLNQRGITNGLMFNFQGGGPDWIGGDTLTAGYEAEYAEMIASLLIYARNTQHVQFTLVGPGNEEDNIPQGVNMTADQYVTALHTLAELLDTNGLGDVRFVGPDLGYTSTDWLLAMMSDSTVMAKLAHFGLHSYQDNAGGSSAMYEFLQQSAYPDRTYWMTEFNVWCDSCEAGTGGDNSWAYAVGAARYLLYHLAYGASAGLVWEAYDSQYNYYSPGQWSYWGLFGVDDTNAVPKTYSPRKTFYTLAQISKFVRPGAQQIAVNGADWPFTLLAFYQPNSGQLTLTGINTNTSTATLSAFLTNLPPVASLDLYYTDSTTNLCYGATFPVTNGVLTATLPADCVFTLVGLDPNQPAVSVLLTNPPNGSRYSAPATIPIQASVTTTTGEVSQVEFFCGTTNLGEVFDPPYSITWSNVPPGVYELTASATNSVGDFRVSPTVRITVVGPLVQISITPSNAAVVPYSTHRFTATAADALGTIISPPPEFVWSVSGGGTIDTGGEFTAGDSVGGPFTIIASTSGITGTASLSITTNLNLAPAGVAYTWYSLARSTNNSPQAPAPGLNDGDLSTDVSLGPDGAEDIYRAYEAAGVLWDTPQSINRVIFQNGSYDSFHDGVFAAGFGLQFSLNGTTWTNADPVWTVAPAYAYNSVASANVGFAFTGGVATVRGVRCVGRVHTVNSKTNSWVAFATELQAFAAPAQPVKPHITLEPASQTVLAGATVNFNVAASGSPFLNYQWLFNGASLTGAVTETLTLTNLQPAQAGDYRVVVTNAGGSATSAVATLIVWLPPAITLQPSNQVALVGDTVNFSVAASGTEPLSYQWLCNGTNLEGAVAEALSLTNLQPAQVGGYSVVVTNIAGSVTSAVATLALWVPPVITLQPANQTALVGATVNLSVAASGTEPLSYQWLFNGTNLDGAVAAALSLTNVQPAQAGGYAAQIGNPGGITNSAVALLTVIRYPLLLDPRTTTTGGFTFTLDGDAGCTYVIDVSTNLVEWAPLGTLSNAVGRAEFTDSGALNSTSRFYRARLASTP